MLSKLRIRSAPAWEITSRRLLFLLHKYRARDFAIILHLFHHVKEVEFGDEVDVISPEALHQKNWQSVSDVIPEHFFERVVSMLPMHIPRMTNQDLVRTLEVLVARELGG